MISAAARNELSINLSWKTINMEMKIEIETHINLARKLLATH